MNIGDGQGRGRQCKRKWGCQICLTCCARGLSLRNGLAGPRIIQPKAKAPETDTSGQVVSPLPFAINFHLTMSISAAHANACSMQHATCNIHVQHQQSPLFRVFPTFPTTTPFRWVGFWVAGWFTIVCDTIFQFTSYAS